MSEEQVRKDEAGAYARASLTRLAGVLAALGVAYRAPLTLDSRPRAARLTRGTPRRRCALALGLVRQPPWSPVLERMEFSARTTSVATREGWQYLAVLIDVSSRRVVGWALADRLRAALALDALAMALHARRPPPGLVRHTARGGQYTAAAYQACLAACGVTCSMSRAGECLDNAMVERCFATLKAELVDARTWPTRATARTAIFAWLAVWYNRQRRHSALGYRSNFRPPIRPAPDHLHPPLIVVVWYTNRPKPPCERIECAVAPPTRASRSVVSNELPTVRSSAGPAHSIGGGRAMDRLFVFCHTIVRASYLCQRTT